MFLVAPELDNYQTYDLDDHVEGIMGAKLVVELRNRFMVISDDDGSIAMIFTAMHFNVSPVLTEGRMFLVIQVYDIQKEEIIMLQFYLGFVEDDTAHRFYKYVKENLPSVTNDMIPVDIPSYISYLSLPHRGS